MDRDPRPFAQGSVDQAAKGRAYAGLRAKKQ